MLFNRNTPPIRVTPEALAAWKARDKWALHRAIGLRPWEVNPLDAVGNQPRRMPIAWAGRIVGGIWHPQASLARWERAVEWRKALERAASNA